MKKLLLLTTLLATGLLSCAKEEMIKTENYEHSPAQKLNSRMGIVEMAPNYIITKCFERCKEIFSVKKLIGPIVDLNLIKGTKKLFLLNATSPLDYTRAGYLWYMNMSKENYVKLYSRYPYPFMKIGALDIDSKNLDEGSTYAIIREKSDDYNQEWQLIGRGNINSSDHYEQFLGVIVNRHTGRMLSIRNKGNRTYVTVDRLYAGSDEEKHFDRYGHFDMYENPTHIWGVRRVY